MAVPHCTAMTRDALAAAEQSAFRALNSVVGPAVQRGVGNSAVGLGLFLVESLGRKSGKVRTVPLLGERYGSKLVVTTVRPHSQWVRNLEAEPSAHVWVGGKRRSATATVRHFGNVAVATLRLAGDDTAAPPRSGAAW